MNGQSVDSVNLSKSRSIIDFAILVNYKYIEMTFQKLLTVMAKNTEY